MSDLEYEDESLDFQDENEINDVDEIDLELIKLVKKNPILWNKSSKSYNNSIEKDRIWEYIGSILPIKMAGIAAAKRFRTLRTTFSRHFKKVKQSQPRSGAGSDWPIYQPTWPLYEELLFLADVIKTRQTKSNTFVKPTNILKSKTNNYKKIKHNATIIASDSNHSTTQVVHSSPTYNSQLQHPVTYDINQTISEKYNSSQNLTQVSHSSIPESDNESSTESSASISEHSTKKLFETPPPDNFFRKKKIKHDHDINNLDKLAGALVTISQQIAQSPDQHEEKTTPTADEEVENFI